MTATERDTLLQKQNELMELYAEFESLQTEYGYIDGFYKYIQCQMDELDSQADFIRRQLMGGDV